MMRPDELHSAMRADLVCILKDVVGLIARIEATLPSPEPVYHQPAHSSGVQSEGSGKHGDDQRAQKSEAVAAAVEAGAAEAGEPYADRRNSSRESGEVASAPLSVDRTPVSKQPTDAALPPSVEAAAPPVAARLSPETTAGAPLQAGITSQPKAVLIPKAQAKPKSKPLDPRPGKLVGVVIDAPGTVLALDMKQLVAVGPKGDWDIGTRPVALIMERMRNGETFGDNVLAEIGSMGTDTFRESRKRWATELANIGVAFIHTKGVGCRIEVAK